MDVLSAHSWSLALPGYWGSELGSLNVPDKCFPLSKLPNLIYNIDLIYCWILGSHSSGGSIVWSILVRAEIQKQAFGNGGDSEEGILRDV